MTPPTLCCRSATVVVGGRSILDGVSVTLPPGSMTAVLGPNGSGKTTLLRVLSGVLAPTSGEVQIDGSPIRRLARTAVARLCAYLPQQASGVFDLAVEDAVWAGRYPHLGSWGGARPIDFQAVEHALERVGIADLRRRSLRTLSGGERQRVFLARALAQQAPILLLDEPATYLDIGGQIELMELLGGLNREGRTVVAAVHDLSAAVRYFPLAVLLHGGRATAAGPTSSVVFGRALESAFGVRAVRGEDCRFQLIGVGDGSR